MVFYGSIILKCILLYSQKDNILLVVKCEGSERLVKYVKCFAEGPFVIIASGLLGS